MAAHRPDESKLGGIGAGLHRSRSYADPGRPVGDRQVPRPSLVRAPSHAEGNRRRRRRAAFGSARSTRAQRQPARGCTGNRRQSRDQGRVVDRLRRVHASWLHADRIRRRLWRLALSLPRLDVRYRRTHPQRSRTAEPGDSRLFLPVRFPHQSRLRSAFMSGPSTYVPQTDLTRWLDSRLPILRLAHDTVWTFPTPRNLNFWYAFGAILTFCLGVQIVTGIVLAMHYVPNAGLAFDSVENIMRDVNYGWLLRYVHSNGASMFFLAVYVHMFRGLYYGSYKAPREVLWILGVIIYLLMVVTAFMGYVLPWGQMSFWAATVITNLFTSLDQVIPHLGTVIAIWLWGDFAVGDATLNRFFSLHYLLPFVIAAVVGLHIWALHVPGNNNPLGI